MAKNLIPDVCKFLGVEVGEEFKIRDGTDCESVIEYYIDQNGVLCEAPYNEIHEPAYGVQLSDLLNGYAEIVKLPWKPKDGEIVWTFLTRHGKICVAQMKWIKCQIECLALQKAGWVYRTREEAEAALPKVAEELGAEYEI